MILGVESFDYLAVGNAGPFLGQLGWYSIQGTPQVSAFTRFNYGNSLRFSGSTNSGRATWLLPNGAQPDIGFGGMAMYIAADAESSRPFFYLANSITGQGLVSVTFMDFGVIRVARGVVESDGSTLGPIIYNSPGGTWKLDGWFFVEFGITVDDATVGPSGAFELRFNTVPLCAFTNITTAPNGTTFYDSVRVGTKFIPGNRDVWWDDLYMLDDQGTRNNDFLGNSRVQGLLPNATGANTDWIPSPSPPNWQQARNQDIDDTTFVRSTTTGDYDLYEIEPLVNTPEVFGIQVKGAYRQDDATQRFAVNRISSNGTEVDGTPRACYSSYVFQFDIFESDPDTTMQWLPSAVNLMQIGPKVET